MEVVLKLMIKCLLIFTAATLFIACNNKNGSADKKVDSSEITTADSPSTSSHNTKELESLNYQVIHFWDNLDLQKNYSAKNLDYLEQNFANYLALFPLVSAEIVNESLSAFVNKSAADKRLLDYVSQLFDKYLYDPNSPARNDLYYEYALTQLLGADDIPLALKAKLEIVLELVKRNQQGDIAKDFSFLTNDGQKKRLSAVDAKYTILIFYVPGCHSCEELIHYWNNNSTLHKPVLDDNLKVLAIYTDGDEIVWKDYQDRVPNLWLNGMDEKMELFNSRIYDLKSSPTIYILDKDKKVIVKDASMDQLVQFINAL